MGRKTNAPESEGDLRPEYDLSKLKLVGRGIFAERFRRGTNLAQLIERDRRANEEQAEVDDLRPEYDLSKLNFVGRGIYAGRFRSGTNLALLARDVRETFPDDQSVNEALRVIAKAAKQQGSRARKAPVRTKRQSPMLRRTG